MIKKYYYTSFAQPKKFCAMHWLTNKKAHFWTFDKNVKKKIEMMLMLMMLQHLPTYVYKLIYVLKKQFFNGYFFIKEVHPLTFILL